MVLNPVGGNVGIGTTDLGAKLTVDTEGGTQPSLKLEHHGSNFIVPPLNAGDKSTVIENMGGGSLLINPNGGNVGIGTTTPPEKLAVAGNILLTAPDNRIWSFALERIDESNRLHQWKFWHMNSVYGKDELQLWEYKADKSGNMCGGDRNDEAMCDCRMTIKEGGNVHFSGSISCGGKIGIKSASYDNAYLSIHKEGWPSSDHYVDVRDHFLGDEQFTLEMACSRDFKENINELTAREALTTLAKLNPIKYDYKGEKSFRQNLGFIAEEMPDNLASFDKKSISPFEVIPILTRVVQEQQRTIVKLESLVERVLQAGNP